MLDHLFEIIQQYVKLTDDDRERCRDVFEPVSYSRHSILEKAGTRPGFMYFIIDGYLRLYSLDESGNEITTHINCPPGFITSYTHFMNQTVSADNLEAITDCRLLRISRSSLIKLTNESAAFKDFSIQVYQQSIAYNEKRSRELASLSATQRYQSLVQQYPSILQQVPLQYIASFLGINPKSLSRIRKQIW